MASDWILEVLNRNELHYDVRTRYYNGTGTAKLLLAHRPVYTTPEIQVWVDENGFWGETSGAFSSTPLTYGSDFFLQLDTQENGTSRSGILVRRSRYWTRPTLRQNGYLSPYIGEAFGNIKVTYAAGYRVDNLPPVFRLACNILVARLRALFPLGWVSSSESYEDRSVSVALPQKRRWLEEIWAMIGGHRNWKW